MSFGKQLRLRREELGLSRAALAEELGVSASAVIECPVDYSENLKLSNRLREIG